MPMVLSTNDAITTSQESQAIHARSSKMEETAIVSQNKISKSAWHPSTLAP